MTCFRDYDWNRKMFEVYVCLSMFVSSIRTLRVTILLKLIIGEIIGQYVLWEIVDYQHEPDEYNIIKK